ncbi:MAG: metallophosphoesterase, partial [Clostridia bacterium]|nr:metallophosphoesterase [Clostridia bacterium]
MKVFAISDLHMPGKSDKPMNVFGKIWDNYLDKIKSSWERQVGDDDIVLLPGDLSWAMRLSEVDEDLQFIAKLPGKKVLLKGNHDYWWQGVGKVREILPENVYAIQNDALKFGNVVICGTRGWTCPNTSDFTKEDEKIYLRETERLKLSLKKMQAIKEEGDNVIAMTHFPPFNVRREPSNYTALFADFGVKTVVYGHLHGGSHKLAMEGLWDGVEFRLVSADYLAFKPFKVNF